MVNFVITKITPIAVANIGWKTFIILECFRFATGAFVFVSIPETKRLSLENIYVLFGTFGDAKYAEDFGVVLRDENGLKIERSERFRGPRAVGSGRLLHQTHKQGHEWIQPGIGSCAI